MKQNLLNPLNPLTILGSLRGVISRIRDQPPQRQAVAKVHDYEPFWAFNAAVIASMDSGSSDDVTIQKGFQWLLAPTDLDGQNPGPSQAPDVVNNS